MNQQLAVYSPTPEAPALFVPCILITVLAGLCCLRLLLKRPVPEHRDLLLPSGYIVSVPTYGAR